MSPSLAYSWRDKIPRTALASIDSTERVARPQVLHTKADRRDTLLAGYVIEGEERVQGSKSPCSQEYSQSALGHGTPCGQRRRWPHGLGIQ